MINPTLYIDNDILFEEEQVLHKEAMRQRFNLSETADFKRAKSNVKSQLSYCLVTEANNRQGRIYSFDHLEFMTSNLSSPGYAGFDISGQQVISQ